MKAPWPLILLFLSLPLAAATPKMAPACTAPAYRAFDFFAGDWDAFDPKGALLGHNRVEIAHDGCVLIEHWNGVEGDTGTSLNMYDANRKVWNETWASNHGTLLSMDGGMHGDSMVMIGLHVEKGGHVALHRNVWTPVADGVHQVWDYSLDGGRTWVVNYDGYLRKRGAIPAR